MVRVIRYAAKETRAVAIKPPELLNRLPSVSELLEKPPIRALADRWNRSIVASRVRTFLDDVRSDVQRRASELPSVRELAERAARYVISQQQVSLGIAVNATGKLWGPLWSSQPLADVALERMMALGREFAKGSSCEDSAPADPAALICRLTGAEAAVAVHSYSGAVCLALAALGPNREVLIARGDVGDVDPGNPIPKLAAAANVALKEVGTINRTLAADFETAISPRSAAILKLVPDDYRVVGDTSLAVIDELVALSRDRELMLIDALGATTLAEPPTAIEWIGRSAKESISAGVDIAIVCGDKLIGGPASGIILGSRTAIRRIADHPLFPAWRLDALRTAALVATLECYDGLSQAAHAIPVWQCLTAPIENLQNRAERIAPQLAIAPGIASAVAIETRSPLSLAHSPSGGWRSYGVALVPSDGDVLALDRRFKSAAIPVVGRIENSQLVLDIRTILPRQDTAVIEALVGAAPTPTPA
jgi:L-seryl-tRNA(Ser) seleniumtransferase